MDPWEVRNVGHYLFASNDPAALPIDADDRRFTVLQVSGSRAGDQSYFHALYAALEGAELDGFVGHCQRLDLSDWNHRQPYQNAAKSNLAAAVIEPELEFWLDALSSGELPDDMDDPNGGFGGRAANGPNWSKEEVFVSKRSHYEAYRRFAQDRRERLRPGRYLLEKIQSYCPEAVPHRPWQDRKAGKRGPEGLRLPPLGVCRTSWDRRAGPRNWGEKEE